MKYRALAVVLLAFSGLLTLSPDSEAASSRPADIIDVQTVIPDVVLDIRYTTAFNFVGRPIPGYRAAKCLLTRNAATALKKVQRDLKLHGLSLKIYDCYRPQTAVNSFVRWAEALQDRKMKAAFYPSVEKRHLFRDGYIAAKSGHSRASTLDVTIVPFPVPPQPPFPVGGPLRSCENPSPSRFPDNSIDMGTGFDCFSTLSHTLNPATGAGQRANRALLVTLMDRYGFNNLAEEWWHFTLRDEPYPDTYFDFPVE